MRPRRRHPTQAVLFKPVCAVVRRLDFILSRVGKRERLSFGENLVLSIKEMSMSFRKALSEPVLAG